MSEDVKSSSGTLDLSRYYEVSVYAMAEGYLPSETVKAKINMGRGAINLWQLVDSDVNSDGMVNSADVVSVYNYIINGK